jgi:probable phosphomutase (TIGR03848 family)
MVQFLLVRHAINEWVKTGKLAGWTPGVHLNDDGRKQAEALGERLSTEKITAIYSSPLERTMETAEAIAKHHPDLTVQQESGIGEVRYGKWEGKKIKKLAKKKKWQIVQHVPSRMTFPKGESMRGTQMRAVDTIENLYAQYKDDENAVIVLVFHADLIKMVVAHYLGVHLDLFQRIVISPASITRLLLDDGRPFLATVNDTSHNPPLPKPEPDEEADEDTGDEVEDDDDLNDEEDEN